MTFTPRTWVVGEVVSAALMNQEIRDQWNTVLGGWTAYTPVWTAATTNPSLGNGTLTGQYMKIGRTCHVMIKLVMGSTTTYGSGSWRISLPFQASGTDPGALSWSYSTSASSNFILGASPLPNSTSTSDNIWLASQSTPGDWDVMNSTVPLAHAASYILRGWGTYQTAS